MTSRAQRGMAYLLLLFALATTGLLLAGFGRNWHTTAQRESETELLFIGQQFSRALASYKARSPQGTPTAPQRLEDLLEDPRFPFTVRHLREIPRDPMSGQRDWGVERQENRIIAIYSLSERAPRRRGQLPEYIALRDGRNEAYRDWLFNPGLAPTAAAATQVAN